MEIHEVYRYVVTEGESLSVAYLLPVKDSFVFVNIGLDGSFLSQVAVDVSEDKVIKAADRDSAILAALGSGR